jgi:DNA adenine methylase
MKAILADLNGRLIGTLAAVKRNPVAVFRHLSSIPRNATTYYAKRQEFNAATTERYQDAALFIYLNRNCFNGLWRTDTQGKFNVPFGGDKSGATPSLEVLVASSEALKRASLMRADFRTTLKLAMRPDAFVYIDPPYFSDEERVFVEYGARQFCSADLTDLLDLLRELDATHTRFVFTYRDSRAIRKRCARWAAWIFGCDR